MQRTIQCIGKCLLLSLVIGMGCSKKMTEADCHQWVARGIGLAASVSASVSGEMQVDIAALKARAKGPHREAITAFEAVCVGADQKDQNACVRRAKTREALAQCGELPNKAARTGEILLPLMMKKHNAYECSAYAEHAVKIRAVSAEDVGKLVRQCDEWMAIGFYQCRVRANDVSTWKACDSLE